MGPDKMDPVATVSFFAEFVLVDSDNWPDLAF